jgi:hypothetical protein
VRRVTGRRLSDQHQIGPGGLELLPSAMQLHRVRAAVGSAVVAQPHEGDRALARADGLVLATR